MHRLFLPLFLLSGLLLSASAKTQVTIPAVPTLSPDGKTLVFCWNGDIWRVPTSGGQATALTRHPGIDQWCRFSPDGKEIAFTSNRYGKSHLFVMPATGGEPTQIGFHSEGYTPECWTPDGKGVLFSGWRDHFGISAERMFITRRDKRAAEELVFDAFGDNGRLSPDGKKLLFTRDSVTLYRKGYRGSRASTIWLYDREQGTFSELCNHPGGNRSPMWKADASGFYFLSQENAPCFNIWEHDFASSKNTQRTFHDDAAIILPAISRDGDTIVYRQLFDFYRFSPNQADAEPEKIDIHVVEDSIKQNERRRWYSSVWNNDETGNVDWTRSGKEICFTAGGDLWVMDTVLKKPVQVTKGTIDHETECMFSKDDRAIYFLRDNGLGVNIMRATRADPAQPWWLNTEFKVEALTDDTHTRNNLGLSPDGETLSFTKDVFALKLSDKNGKNERHLVDGFSQIYYDWAPDSKWVCATLKDTADNYDIWILSTDPEPAAPPYNLSRHSDYDMGGTWSPDGSKIAFFAERGVERELDIHWVYLRQEDEQRHRAEFDLARAKSGGTSPKTPDNIPVEIDFEGLTERIHRVTNANSRDYSTVWSHDGKALAFRGTVKGKAGMHKISWPNPGSPAFLTSNTGTNIDWRKEGMFWLLNRIPAKDATSYSFKVYQTTDVVEYKRLAFRKIWRTLRDEFYDASMNGKDWEAMRVKYEDTAANTTHWYEFGRCISMLEGELNASHTGFRQDYKEWKLWDYSEWEEDTGHLGLRFDHATKGPVAGLRIRELIPGSPCDRDGNRVLPGEYLVSVDGRAAKPGMDIAELMNGRSGQPVTVTISKVSGEQREMLLVPDSYKKIRDRVEEAWRDHNEQLVSEWSDDRYAYIHVDQMNWEKFNRFEHEMHSIAYGKEALVLDIRNNGGGFTADRMLAILSQPDHAFTIPRNGVVSYPRGYLVYTKWDKPIVVLCNQYTGSNGEIFSHAIKTMKRGQLVGVPTQGAVISMPSRKILDIGSLSLPRRGWFVGDTGEDMEMNGAVPDHIVELHPTDIPDGRDPQLKKAVEVLKADVDEWKKIKRPTARRAAELRRSGASGSATGKVGQENAPKAKGAKDRKAEAVGSSVPEAVPGSEN